MNKIITFLILAAVLMFFLNIPPETNVNMAAKMAPAPSGKAQPRMLFDGDHAAWQSLQPYQAAGDLTFEQNRIVFKTAAEDNDEWDYIYLAPDKYSWNNYAWEFTAVRHTPFREFAFNFRNLDFDNRYRYRFEDDKIFFDKKVRGSWTNNIASIPFPMELDKPYRVRIETLESLNRCWVDGRLMLENVDRDIPSGSIAVILWEDDGKTNIDAEVYDNRVMELI